MFSKIYCILDTCRSCHPCVYFPIQMVVSSGASNYGDGPVRRLPCIQVSCNMKSVTSSLSASIFSSKIYLYAMEFYWAVKEYEILSFVGKWIELEDITLSEVSQVQKAKGCHVFSHVWNIHLIQIHNVTKNRSH
jgi:hypothetical protein